MISNASLDSQKKVEIIKNLRENVNWKIEKERLEFLDQVYRLVDDWKVQLPNLLDIFRPEQIERLLFDSMTFVDKGQYLVKLRSFIRFAARSGYKDKPEVDEAGESSSPRRTTPVHYAARYTYEEAVLDLFKIYDRFDVNYVDESGVTHFHVACMFGFDDVVEKFLESGQDPNGLYPKTGNSPLHLAVDPGAYYGKNMINANVVRSLLRSGADSNLVNAEGFTPLHYICNSYFCDHNYDVVKMLFEMSNDGHRPLQVNPRDKLGNTPLHYVVVNSHEQSIVKLLLRNGADRNAVNLEGSTPLHMFCSKEFHWECDDYMNPLFEIGDDIDQPLQLNARDKLGNTPLHYAMEDVETNEIAIQLLRNGANPNLANAEGLTPLHIFCRREYHWGNDAEFVNTLFEIGDDVDQPFQLNARDKLGRTPLHSLLQRDESLFVLNLAEILVRRNADPNLADAEGSTALHLICKLCYVPREWMESFFEICEENNQPVQIDTLDKLGRTPLQWAVALFDPNTVDLLLDRGADLPSFVFPSESHFTEARNIYHNKYCYFELRLVVDCLGVIEHLAKRGYELEQSDASKIMKTFHEFGLFTKSADLDEFRYDDEEFASRAKLIIIRPGLSLYDLIRLRPKEIEKSFTYADYLKFDDVNQNWYLLHWYLPQWKACELYLREMLSRGFFRRWALYPFWKLINYRLPVECCEMVIEELMNEDLYNICLVAESQSS